ncbi:MAG: ABC transporter permease [Runella slithyformis]|nr:MAG: ABC transporter permease [Runella slithyformis]
MSKITLIAEREFMTRVRKKSFIIMSILGPILFAALIAVPIWIGKESSETLVIQVVDESKLFVDKFKGSENLKFTYTNGSIDESKKKFNSYQEEEKREFDGILYIPAMNLDSPTGISYFSEKSLSAFTQGDIEKTIAEEIENQKLVRSGIDKNVLDKIRTKINISTINLSQEGEKKSSSGAASVVGYIAAFLIYMFIFLYGSQVMRGVIEEKTTRIVEVIISSVKPFELMMGKILGIAGVALTQFLIWVALSTVVSMVVSSIFGLDAAQTSPMGMGANAQMPANLPDNAAGDMINSFYSLNLPLIIFSFGFYFLFGYLMYGALFGAVGSAVDNETDSQQLVLPITIPLILSIVMISAVLNNPNGSLAFWFSIIPLTSPVIMMVRLPFIGFTWELVLSMALLVGGFIGATWVAARIYRVGILMYGKKPSFKELGKWLFYKV